MQEPLLLSICIPTYNRAEALDKSLQSIVNQKAFQKGKIEIIISDNNSIDKTYEVIKKYQKKYRHKIKYFKNKSNLEEYNFYLSMIKAKGKLIKLSNDTLIYKEDSLEKIMDMIKQNESKKPVIFFLNKNLAKVKICTSLNDFIKIVSYMTTWAGAFAIWQEDIKYLKEFQRKSKSKLPQTYTLLKMVAKKQQVLIYPFVFCTLVYPSLKGAYNLSEVFIKNYLGILKQYVIKGSLNKKVYQKEVWQVLKKHVLPRQFNVKNQYQYDKKYFWQYTKPYHYSIKFYILVLLVLLKKVKYIIKNAVKQILRRHKQDIG